MRFELHPFLELPFLFVTGQARSGTTVLTRAVGSHPDVFSNMMESNYIGELVWTVRRTVEMEVRNTQLAVSPETLKQQFANALFHVLFPLELWDSSAPPKAVSTFSAMRVENADFLLEFLPHLHVVNIVRNGLEVVASRMAHEHIGKRDFREHCVAWAAAMEMIDWGAKQDSFTLFRHEQFLDPQKTVETFDQLFAMFNLPASSQPAEFVSQGIINSTRTESDTDESAKDLRSRRDRWRTWTQSQRATFEEVCAAAMHSLGYEMPW